MDQPFQILLQHRQLKITGEETGVTVAKRVSVPFVLPYTLGAILMNMQSDSNYIVALSASVLNNVELMITS